MSKPAIVFVGGFWEGSGVFDDVRAVLQKQHGYSTTTVARLSTGSTTPNNPTQEDDIRVIRTALEAIINKGNKVILVVHSSGGFIGTGAVPGLTVTERKAAGLQGGVAKIVALTATLVRQASLTRDQFPPFWDPRDDSFLCKDPEKLLFNGVDRETTKKGLAELQPEPEWFSWDRPPTYGPELFEKVPAVYLVCKEDRATPVEAQKMWANAAKAEIKECDAGHMVMLSHPEVVVDVVRGAAESVS
ncbi:MAG: hypothetical protein Q9165_003754 [Trypethelium subeluteriae]